MHGIYDGISLISLLYDFGKKKLFGVLYDQASIYIPHAHNPLFKVIN